MVLDLKRSTQLCNVPPSAQRATHTVGPFDESQSVSCKQIAGSLPHHIHVIRRLVLAALARGIAADSDAEARAALDRADPVLRGSARRRLGYALIDAELLAIDAAPASQLPPAHVMRVAAIKVAGKAIDPARAGDVAAVEAAYRALAIRPMRRAPIATIAVAAIALGGAGAAAYAIATHHAPARTFAKIEPAPAADAFTRGGVPLGDPAIDAALAQPLTELVVTGAHLEDDGAVGLAAAMKALRAVDLGHGRELAAAWQHAIDAFGVALAATQIGSPSQLDQDHLRGAVRELTAQLAAAGLGYFLEGRFHGGFAVIQSYRVAEVAYVYADGAPHRVLSIARLDHLNTAYAVLGMNDEDVGDPVIHLERIAEYVATTELPALAPDAPYPVADPEWLLTSSGKQLAAAAGAAVRREYAAALGDDAAAGAQIAKLLVERGHVIEQWRDQLDRKGIAFSRTDDLFIAPKLLTVLDGDVPHYQIERVAAIDDELAGLEAPRIHGHLHALVAATVRRHEAQHDVDFARVRPLRYPARLAYMLGPDPDPLVASARAELAAYTSQVVNDPLTPHASLWHLMANVFTTEQAGTGEFYAGVVLLEALGKQVGATADGELYDRDRLAAIALAVAKLSDDELRAAARGAWRDLFGEAPTVIVDAPRFPGR